MPEAYPVSIYLYALSNLISSVIFIALAVFVLVYGRHEGTDRLFALWCISVSIWAFGVYKQTLATDATSGLLWSRALHASAAVIPALFLHFILSFLNSTKRRLTLCLYALGIGFSILSVYPGPLLIKEVSPITQFTFYPKAGPLYKYFLAFFSFSVLSAFYALWKAYESSRGLQHNQIRYLLFGTIFGFAGGTTAFFHVFDVPIFPFGNYGLVALCATIICYAIVKHRLMDITVAMEKGLTYLLLLGVILVPSYVMLLKVQEVHFGNVNYSLSAIWLLLFTVLVIGTYKVKPAVQSAIARLLFRRRHDMYETLSKFSKAMVTILDLKTLKEEIVRTLANVLGVTGATLYLLDKEKDVYHPVASSAPTRDTESPERLAVSDPVPHHLAKVHTILVLDELKVSPASNQIRAIVESLQAMEAEVCIPFINKNSLIGFCNLGIRTNHQMYSDQDINLLTSLAQAAAIALDNAVLYEELKRSQTLMRRTDRLRSLETIAGGFAHEVRNPLTSIKTFIQLTPERKDDPEFIGQFSTVVAEDVARIERLIQEILDYARYMQPKFQEEDINVIVESCLYFVRFKADSKAVLVTNDLASALPSVLLDRQQIKQVLLNLFINAIDAMGDHDGQLIVRTHRLSKTPGDTWVQIEITDTGCGISPADLEHIFDPFYTTKHESQEREGTGLGLTIVHQIVHEHGGHIEVKSELGRGTTFLVNLPAVSARVLETPIETPGV